MAEANNNSTGGAQIQPGMNVMAQYVKDLSFENPNAPRSLGPRGPQPSIDISINVQADPVNQGGAPSAVPLQDFEVALKIEVDAKDGAQVLFAIELVYAGIFRLTGIPAEQVPPVVMIECPRLLFPFARQIISEVASAGGFPQLLLDPVDFAQLFRQRMAQQAGQQAPRMV